LKAPLQEIKDSIENPLPLSKGGFSLGAKERLKSKKAIEQLFLSGKGVSLHPLRLVYMKTSLVLSDESGAKNSMRCAFSVSKRRFKSAVDRNKVKRLLREAYRRQKPELLAAIDASYVGMLLFNSNEIPSQEEVNKNLAKLLEKWLKNVSL